ncbi:hypothetical protein WJX75_000297 [Coccomyxa subellipsoidea]|uniref:A-kinase anchor protein 7-like phosphoesterase domain-containing protein n=1 Tax=Coccomyxa subellipsoidea TaxID=248742 RepID=A0ABR2YIV2_9CHLO
MLGLAKTPSTSALPHQRWRSRKKRLRYDEQLSPAFSPPPAVEDAKRKQKRMRPTHFIAARVSLSESVIKAMESVQDALIAHTPALRGALVDPITAHFTLMVMPLDGEVCLQAAQHAMVALQYALQECGQHGPFCIEVAGLSHFREQVLYLDVVKDAGHERLVSLAAATRSHFVEAGIADGDDGRPFTAHITIAKLSNLFKGGRRKRCGAVKSIPEEAYAGLIGIKGGSVSISELQLCRMQGRENGAYYHVEASLTL